MFGFTTAESSGSAEASTAALAAAVANINSLIYGNFSKEQGPKTYVANSINTWKGNSEDFFGLMISLNFKIKKKILLSLNLSSLNEDFIYRGKRLNKEVLGINLNYRF